jgi:hypothetical protein
MRSQYPAHGPVIAYVMAVSGALERGMTPDGSRDAVAHAGVFAVLAAFPRLAYPRRWRTLSARL